MVSVLGLATAVPPHRLDQHDVYERASRIYASTFARFPTLTDVFANAGIDQRYSTKPIEWFDEPHDWSDRTEAYLEGGRALFLTTAREALDKAGLRPRDVDIVVTVSSTGIATPSLEARVASELGLRPDVARVPVFGLGCAGGVSGLSIGARMARAEPGAVVLTVVVELCTLAFRADRSQKADVISSALFGDGAAAVVLRDDRDNAGAMTISHAAEHTWPDTLDIMGWSIDPIGLGVVLSRSLPKFVEQRLTGPVRGFADEIRVQSPGYVFHPGGAKVIDAVQHALDLRPDDVNDERGVLRDYGNMSAPTVLFVLERALKRGLAMPIVMAALGPGFTASLLALEAGHA